VKIKLQLLTVFLATFVGACDPNSVPKLGTYQGNLLIKSNSLGRNSSQEFAVSASLSRPTRNSMHLEITGEPKMNSTLDFTLGKGGQKAILSITGSIPDFSLSGQELSLDGECFTSKPPLNISVCSKQTTIVVKSSSNQPIFNLTLEYFNDVASTITLEAPQKFTLDEAVIRTMNMAFGTQEEFLHQLQAHLGAKQAYLALVPHLTYSTVFGLATSGPLAVVGALGMAGDLTPFIFPSRWLQAKQSAKLAKVEDDTYALMRGAVGLQVEIMAYGIDHDSREIEVLGVGL